MVSSFSRRHSVQIWLWNVSRLVGEEDTLKEIDNYMENKEQRRQALSVAKVL